MEDSVSSITLLERAGLNTLLAPYDGPVGIRSLIIELQDGISDLPDTLRSFQRWVDLSDKEIDTGHPPQQDLRSIFQTYV